MFFGIFEERLEGLVIIFALGYGIIHFSVVGLYQIFISDAISLEFPGKLQLSYIVG